MAFCLDGLLDGVCAAALAHRRRLPPEAISAYAKARFAYAWDRLHCMGLALLSNPLPKPLNSACFKSTVEELLKGISRALHFLPKIADLIPSSGPVENNHSSKLRVGSLNAGRLGCQSDIRGTTIRWESLTIGDVSASCVMKELELDILGLPAARLPENFSLPGTSGLAIHALGGPSHASIAVIWKSNNPRGFNILVGLGSSVRVWVICPLGASHLCAICFLYLPTSGDAALDALWLSQFQDMKSELSIVCDRYPGLEISFLLIGDWNVQPKCLSGCADPHPCRDRAVNDLLAGGKFCLLNPPVVGSLRQSFLSPLRKSKIDIRVGDTRCGGGASRALDLGICSSSLDASLTIHNALHCRGVCACMWPHCFEALLSDHFPIVVEIASCMTPNSVRETQFPAELHCADRWASAFDNASLLLSRITDVAQSCRSFRFNDTRGMAKPSCQWLLDALSFLQCFTANVVREGWVLPSVRPSGPGGKENKRLRNNIHEPLSMTPERISEVLCREVQSNADLPLSTISKCFKFLRKHKPEPSPCMMQDGVALTCSCTHRAWCAKLQNQCRGPVAVAPSRITEVVHSYKSAMGRAWKFRGEGDLDIDISEPAVRGVIADWKNSKALPPDLITRAAYKGFHEAWIKSCWALVRLAGPACYALRPSQWRWVVVGLAFKSGAPSDFDS